VKYYENGRPRFESTSTTKETEAKRLLKEREGRVTTGQPILQRADRRLYEEVVQDFRQYYQTTGPRNLEEAGYRLKHPEAFFTGQRIASIGPDRITSYVVHRRGEGASNATINREMATLSKMLRLAHENNKLLRLPVLRKLKQSALRQGFFERAEDEAVRRILQPDYQVAVANAHTYGWRIQSEVLTLEWRQIDLEAGTVRLDPGAPRRMMMGGWCL
jgi:integrase